MGRNHETNRRPGLPRPTLTLGYGYMFLFSLRFSEPLFVVYLRSRGLSFAMIGLMETMFHIASLSGEIPTGWIADRFGRKASLITGRLLSILSAVLMLAVKLPIGYAIAFMISAYSFNCHSGAFDALIFDDLKRDGQEHDYTRISGLVNSLYLVGSSLAAVIGGIVAQRALQLLYVLTIAADILALAVLLPLRERPLPEVERRKRERIDLGADLRELARAVSDRALGGLMLLWAVGGAITASLHFYGQSYMRDLSVPLPLIGTAVMLGGLLAIVPSQFVHRIEQRWGRQLPLLLGSALLPVGVLIAGLVGSAGAIGRLVVIVMFVAVEALSETLYPLFSSALNALVPSERRATILSIAGMAYSVVMLVAFPLVGICGDAIGLRWGFIVIGAGALVVVGAFALLLKRSGREVATMAQQTPAEQSLRKEG